MKKFQFRLEKVLRVKKIIEKVKMKEVAVINRKIRSLNNDLQDQNNHFADMKEKISGQRQGTTNSIDLMQSLAYVEAIKERSKSIKIKIEFAMHEIDKKRKELSKINSEKMALQKLKKLKLEQFNKTVLAHEQLELDEISQIKSRIVFPPAYIIEENIARF